MYWSRSVEEMLISMVPWSTRSGSFSRPPVANNALFLRLKFALHPIRFFFSLLYSLIFFVFFRVYTVVSGLIRSAVCQSLFYSILCLCCWVFYASLLLPPYPGKETGYDFSFYMARPREQNPARGSRSESSCV